MRKSGIAAAAMLLAAVSLLIAALLFARIETRISNEAEVLQDASDAACGRNNLLRSEVNQQADAFVHHNDATLAWAIMVRPVLDRSTPEGDRAWRATGTLISEYRQVRKQYFTLPLFDCEDPDRPPLEPSEPVAP